MATGTPPDRRPGTREIALLTNPTAGKGRGARYRDVALVRLRDAGFRVRDVSGRDPDEALALARDCVAGGVESLVVCGGDGMVHLGAQAVARTDVALGIIPAGTGNDVARYLDIPRRDPAAAADRVIASRTRRIDLARSGSSWFVTVLAAGFDAVVNERANTMTWPRGQMRYNLATLAELRTFEPLPYTLSLDGREMALDAMLVAVGNGPSFGGGLRITEGAVLDDGLLDVVVIRPMSKARLVRLYPRLFNGTHVHAPEYEHHRVRTVTVAAPGIVAYADGERFGPLPLTITCEPGALLVLS
jgi:diacylglycerol kinase (ATP)